MNQAAPPSGPVRNLPIWETVTRSYGSVFSDHLQHLPRAMLFPLILSALLGLLQSWMMQDTVPVDPSAMQDTPIGTIIIFSLLGLFPYTYFCVAWNRIVLLNEPAELFMRWLPRHWRFLLFSLGLIIAIFVAGFLVGLPVAVLRSIGAPSALVAAVAIAGAIWVAILAFRLSFVFPAISVDERYGFGDAWRQSRGQGFRLLATAILVYVPALVGMMIAFTLLSLLGLPIMILVGGNTVHEPSMIANTIWIVVSSALGYIVLALGQSFIAIAFRTCSGWVPGSPAAAAPVPLDSDGPGEA